MAKIMFGIQESPFTQAISVGLLNPSHTAFLAGEDIVDVETGELVDDVREHLAELCHEDCTDMAIRVVAEHVLKHYAGGLVIEYKDGTKYEIEISKSAVVEHDSAMSAFPSGVGPGVGGP